MANLELLYDDVRGATRDAQRANGLYKNVVDFTTPSRSADNWLEFCKEKASELNRAKVDLILVGSELQEAMEAMKLEYKNSTEPQKVLDEINRLNTDIKYKDTLSSTKQLLASISYSLTLVDQPPESTFPRSIYTSDESLATEKPKMEPKVHADVPAQSNEQRKGIDARPPARQTNYRQDIFEPQKAQVQLPLIKIPEFSGHHEDYPEFYAAFSELIDQDQTLSDWQKVSYLKQAVKGKAQRVIKGIPATASNYNLMLEAIKKKYGNVPTNRSNIATNLTKLRTARADPKDCEDVLLEINCIVNQMRTIGHDIALYNDPLWLNQIYSKFPNFIVEKIRGDNFKKPNFDVGDLLEELDDLINTKDFLAVCKQNSSTHEAKVEKPSRYDNKRDTSVHEKVNYSAPVKNDDSTCIFCKRDHPPDKCGKDMDSKQRIDAVRRNRVCWKCYKKGHNSFDCELPNCESCGKPHNIALCRKPEYQRRPYFNNSAPNVFTPPNTQNNFQNRNTTTGSTHAVTAVQSAHELSANERTPCQNVLMTVVASVLNHNSQHYEQLLILLDSGAQLTIASEKLINRLGLVSQNSKVVEMAGVNGKVERFTSYGVNLQLLDKNGGQITVPAKTKPVVSYGFTSVNLTTQDRKYLEERDLTLANHRQNGEIQEPDLIVGIDLYSDIITTQEAHRLPSGLKIGKSVLGLFAYGSGHKPPAAVHTTFAAFGIVEAAQINEPDLMKEMLEVDQFKDDCEDKKADDYFKEFESEITIENGIATSPFPLKSNVVVTDDNYVMAKCQLKSVYQSLQKYPERRKWYVEIIAKYKRDGIVETVVEPVPESAGTNYMPHHGVWTPSKPSKPLRVVFNGSAKSKSGQSLNQIIDTGNLYIRKIPNVITSARNGKILITCDLQAAFTNIRLSEKHKDLCRFVWFKDVNRPPSNDNIEILRWNRIPFGITASPCVLSMVLKKFLSLIDSELAREIENNLYVDNIILTAESISEGFQKMREIKELFKAISMNVREYITNKNELNEMVPIEDQGKLGDTKVLGVQYHSEFDQISVQITLPETAALTKTAVLRQLHSIFDPLGLMIPAIITLRVLMREIMVQTEKWSDLAPTKLAEKWVAQCKLIQGCQISIDRYLKVLPHGNKLLVFADASKMATAVCAYLYYPENKGSSPIILGRAKLAPKTGGNTIPKLELSAILLGTELAYAIVKSLNFKESEVLIITDSMIALWWIKSQKKLPIFVANRRKKILEEKEKIEKRKNIVSFFHVRTQFNVADIGTRGLVGSELAGSQWVHGPTWISTEPWPLLPLEQLNDGDTSAEADTLELATNTITCLTATIKETPQSLIDPSNYSSYIKLIRVMATLIKCSKLWICKVQIDPIMPSSHEKDMSKMFFEITAADFEFAEKQILLQEQRHLDISELNKRFHGKSFFYDEIGLIRLNSRLERSSLDRDTIQPIFLPNTSVVVKLLLRYYHINSAHCGSHQLLCIIRQRFFINKPSSAVTQCLKECLACRKCHGLPYGLPQHSPLPVDRITAAPAFKFSGVDFTAAFKTKEHEKVYIALFTCLVTRNVHLELVENLSGAAFLNSLIRFISREGVPTIIRADNGSNFRFAASLLEKLHESNPFGKSIMSYSAENKIKWIFNPPHSPWMGGAWEKLIQSVKRAITKAIGRKTLTVSEFLTLLAHIEAMVNTRPMTKPSNSDLSSIPLRPVDLKRLRVAYSLPTIEIGDEDLTFDPTLIQTQKQAIEALKTTETLAEISWKSFQQDYLTLLRDLEKGHKQKRHVKGRTPSVGEFVLVENELLPRGAWSYALIEKLVTSTDGQVRSAYVRYPGQQVLQKPVCKLYPLEIRAPVTDSENTTPAVTSTEISARPVRKAKEIASARISEQAENNEVVVENNFVSTPFRTLGIPHYLTIVFIIGLLIPNSQCLNKTAPFNCTNGILTVFPSLTPFNLCIESHCQNFERQKYPFSIDLVSETKYNTTQVLVKAEGNNSFKASCTTVNYCERAKFGSHFLLGNPHCWPHGAVFMVATVIIALLLVLTIVITCCSTSRKKLFKRKPFRKPAQKHNEIPSGLETDLENEAITDELGNFRNSQTSLFKLPSFSVGLTVSVCALFIATGSTCQLNHLRHASNLICNQNNECYYSYSKELLFDDVHRQQCVSIQHNNKSIGYLKITRRPSKHVCKQTSLYFTKETTMNVTSVLRCGLFGSCERDFCHALRPHHTIKEFESVNSYPGYTGCAVMCLGLGYQCLCPLPIYGCNFYKISHIPISETIFEGVDCHSWNIVQEFEVEEVMYDSKKSRIISLKPYMQTTFDTFNLSIIHMEKPYDISHKFLFSNSETFLLPTDYIVPISCNSLNKAQNMFSTCTNNEFCTCTTNEVPVECNCLARRINVLRKTYYEFPVETSDGTFTREMNDIMFLKETGEITLRIGGQRLLHSALQFTEAACDIEIGPLTGCYNCEHGAHTNITCRSQIPTWVLLSCANSHISLKCTEEGFTTDAKFQFNQATVNEICSTTCKNEPKSIQLSGTLIYHGKSYIDRVIRPNSTSESAWYPSDFHLPDLTPLVNTVKNHWILALSLLSVGILVSLLIYIFGPVALWYMFKLCFEILHLLFTMLTFLVRCLSHMCACKTKPNDSPAPGAGAV